jgi:hypothetical protein
MKNQNISKYVSNKISKAKSECISKDSTELFEDVCVHSVYEDDMGLYRCITCSKTFSEEDLT